MSRISLTQQIEELERERAMRKDVYARQVQAGKLRQSIADFHMTRLDAAIASIRWLQEHEPVIRQRLAP